MKLLFDQNLSPRLPASLADLYPGSIHVRHIALAEATDTMIWEYAKQQGFVIVSKDSDFQKRSLLFGHPPRCLWLRVGNCPVRLIEEVLRKFSPAIHTFEQNTEASYLMLP